MWFSADFHFGHDRVRSLCNRPFDSFLEMDKTIIKNFNAKVSPKDEVYFLGDFMMRAAVPFENYFRQLNGKWHFIVGNHDNPKEIQDLQKKFSNIVEITDYCELNHYKKKFVMCHYPILSWNGKHRGSIHLHGHSHGTVAFHPMAFDVGVDSNNFSPVSVKTIELWVSRANDEPNKQLLIDEKINWEMIDKFGELYDLAVKLG